MSSKLVITGPCAMPGDHATDAPCSTDFIEADIILQSDKQQHIRLSEWRSEFFLCVDFFSGHRLHHTSASDWWQVSQKCDPALAFLFLLLLYQD